MRNIMERILESKNIFVPQLGVVKAETFSTIYPFVNHYVLTEKDYQESRAGDIKELLDIKTHITNPYRRCVGGYERNINIF